MTLAEAVEKGLVADPEATRAGLDDETAWRQEFCCEFVDESTSFMTLDLIRRCHDVGLGCGVDWARLGERTVEAFVGVDVGRFRDVTVIWIWERLDAKGLRQFANSGTPGDRTGRQAASGTQRPLGETVEQVSSGAGEGTRLVDHAFVTRGVVVLDGAPFAEQEEAIAAVLGMRGVPPQRSTQSK